MKHADFLTRHRAALKAEATGITETADKENGGVLTAEQDVRFKAIEADIAHIDAELAAGQKLAETPEQVAARVRAEIAEVTAVCAIAGKPAKAAEFITAGASLSEVVCKLQAERASGDELNANNGGNPPQAEASWDKAINRVNSRVK